jgi:two-component system sensor histidine kinase YesM
MNKRSSQGVLRIAGRALAGGLEWTVVDNGKGISPEKRSLLVQRLAMTPGNEGGPGGFGLVNVNHRIRLNYGPGYGLTLDETSGGGTTVRVFLPWESAAGPPQPVSGQNPNDNTNL